jgi:putative aldouronate transport system permease protein
MIQAGDTGMQRIKKHGFFQELAMNRQAYLLAFAGLLYFLVFHYLPMVGVIIAFKNYRINLGIFRSPWNGLENFRFFFTSGYVWRVTRNTLMLNSLFLGVSVVFQVGIALLLNEVRSGFYKRVSQSLMFLPYFMSWIVVAVISQGFFGTNTGVMNNVLAAIGLPAVHWYNSPELWPGLLTAFYVWKWTGYGVVIYLATISNIDPEYYEAATIDGATHFQQITKITLPLLVPTVIILVLLAIGRIFYGDFGMIYALVGDIPRAPPADGLRHGRRRGPLPIHHGLRAGSPLQLAGAAGAARCRPLLEGSSNGVPTARDPF